MLETSQARSSFLFMRLLISSWYVTPILMCSFHRFANRYFRAAVFYLALYSNLILWHKGLTASYTTSRPPKQHWVIWYVTRYEGARHLQIFAFLLPLDYDLATLLACLMRSSCPCRDLSIHGLVPLVLSIILTRFSTTDRHNEVIQPEWYNVLDHNSTISHLL